MKKLLLLILFSGNAFASGINFMVCNGEFALCAASASVPTGKTIRVDGKEFQEGMAVCPVLKGKAVANYDLMKGSCHVPPGTASFTAAPLGAANPVGANILSK